LIVEERKFETEKTNLKDYIKKVQELGTEQFDFIDSESFGSSGWPQWSNMFYKHINHHLQQFGV
jgi:hypothetical protein